MQNEEIKKENRRKLKTFKKRKYKPSDASDFLMSNIKYCESLKKLKVLLSVHNISQTDLSVRGKITRQRINQVFTQASSVSNETIVNLIQSNTDEKTKNAYNDVIYQIISTMILRANLLNRTSDWLGA